MPIAVATYVLPVLSTGAARADAWCVSCITFLANTEEVWTGAVKLLLSAVTLASVHAVWSFMGGPWLLGWLLAGESTQPVCGSTANSWALRCWQSTPPDRLHSAHACSEPGTTPAEFKLHSSLFVSTLLIATGCVPCRCGRCCGVGGRSCVGRADLPFDHTRVGRKRKLGPGVSSLGHSLAVKVFCKDLLQGLLQGAVRSL